MRYVLIFAAAWFTAWFLFYFARAAWRDRDFWRTLR